MHISEFRPKSLARRQVEQNKAHIHGKDAILYLRKVQRYGRAADRTQFYSVDLPFQASPVLEVPSFQYRPIQCYRDSTCNLWAFLWSQKCRLGSSIDQEPIFKRFYLPLRRIHSFQVLRNPSIRKIWSLDTQLGACLRHKLQKLSPLATGLYSE